MGRVVVGLLVMGLSGAWAADPPAGSTPPPPPRGADALAEANQAWAARTSLPPDPLKPMIPDVAKPDGPYRTPRAGEGFHTNVFGREVDVPPRNRRSISAWDLGLVAIAPGVPHSEITPFGSIYLWRHPDEYTFFRGTLVGFYDEVIFAKSTKELKPFEGVFTFENFTLPNAHSEIVDGQHVNDEELLWGTIRGGAGLGYREQLPNPGHNDNMFELSLLAEPTYTYFDKQKEAASDFVEPIDTFEMRTRLRLRMDAMERNLLELSHRGFALGGDAIYGYRSRWHDWGRDGGSEEGTEGRDYVAVSAYFRGATGVPFVNSDRHRLLGTIHGGTGSDLDRFSGFRIGGGPSGEEYEAGSRAVMPGAAIHEFITEKYIIAIAEYRWEPIFFFYVGPRASVSWVERRRKKNGVFVESEDTLASVGFRVTTGFVFETRIQLDYNYNTGVIRQHEFGGHEVTVHVSKSF